MTLRRTRPVGRSSKRKTLWLNFMNIDTDRVALAAGASVLDASLNAAALALRPFTVIRTRGVFMVMTDQSTGPEFPFGACGFAVVSDQASAIGVTAVPTPITDGGSSLFFSITPIIAGMRATSDIGYSTLQQTRYYDSKAMRKVEVGEDIVLTIENANAGDGMVFINMARILVKTN